MRARRKKRRPSLRVLVLLLAALELPVGLSLCIAEDGHSTIELAHAAVPCTSHFQRHHPGASAVGADDLDDHPCRDVPFLETTARRDAPSSRFASAEVRAIARVAGASASGAFSSAQIPIVARSARARALERSVVLLI